MRIRKQPPQAVAREGASTSHPVANDARDPTWLVALVGLAMLYVGTYAILVVMHWWPVALAFGLALLVPAWWMRPSKNARSLRLILFGVATASIVMAVVLGIARAS
jgi:hypothetical protein